MYLLTNIYSILIEIWCFYLVYMHVWVKKLLKYNQHNLKASIIRKGNMIFKLLSKKVKKKGK